jgi:hypothetical protein
MKGRMKVFAVVGFTLMAVVLVGMILAIISLCSTSPAAGGG